VSGTIANGALAVTATGSAQEQFEVVNKFLTDAPSIRISTCELILRNGERMALQADPGNHALVRLPPRKGNPVGERSAGWGFRARYTNSDHHATVMCLEELRDDSNYARVTVTIAAGQTDLDVAKVVMIDAQMPGANVAGTVPGSPVSTDSEFLGVEYPTSHSLVDAGHVTCWVARKLPIRADQTVTYQAVVGVAPPGQLRRACLRYIERERAHPYRPFLHYNCWYDLGWDDKYTQAQCLDRIDRFGQELAVKRHVKLSSFLFDDGWDDTNSTWDFDKGMPNGFVPLTREAAKFDAAPGAWLSPWGGYADRRNERLAAAKKNGYEVDSQGLALSGPRYYERFRKVCLDLEKQGINQFKFDGTGSPDKQYPGSRFDSDFDAAIALIHDLRDAEPDLFVNLTTGTWPSPFWTLYADSIWRGGYDHTFAGVGTWRQKWITYRDGDTYHGVVLRGPLYPLNSLMLHGIIYATNAEHLGDDPGDDFQDDVQAYFATGTQLQELYVTPSLLTQKNWDDLATAAKWSAAHAPVLKDVHWIGGDPLKLQVYGHAAWAAGKGIVELRNPSDQPQTFQLDIGSALELPSSGPQTYRAVPAPFATRVRAEIPGRLTAGQPVTITLRPFQVATWELGVG
jgi:hypothetical protein